MLISTGTQERILNETPTEGGIRVVDGSIESDSLLATLWVTAISGTLSIVVYTLSDEGKQEELFHFPTISAGTTNLLLKKSGVMLQRFRIVATYSDACTYEVYVRAISGAGESSVRISGSNDWKTSQLDVTTTPTVLIGASLEDRQGLLVKNWSTTVTIYIAESLGNATTAVGYPLAPRDALALDISAGAEIYAVADSGTADIRIAQAGG